MGWPIVKFKIIRVVCIGRGNQKDASLTGSFDEAIQVRNDLLGARDLELAIGEHEVGLCIYFPEHCDGRDQDHPHEFRSAPS